MIDRPRGRVAAEERPLESARSRRQRGRFERAQQLAMPPGRRRKSANQCRLLCRFLNAGNNETRGTLSELASKNWQKA
jgi:hypothetical protein